MILNIDLIKVLFFINKLKQGDFMKLLKKLGLIAATALIFTNIAHAESMKEPSPSNCKYEMNDEQNSEVNKINRKYEKEIQIFKEVFTELSYQLYSKMPEKYNNFK